MQQSIDIAIHYSMLAGVHCVLWMVTASPRLLYNQTFVWYW